MTPASGDLEFLEVAGTVAVVTGGANGIGRGIVRALLEADATVVVADVEQDVLDTTVAALSASHPGRISGVVTDVSDEASTDELAAHVFALHGRCNLLFNNAGVGSGGGGRMWTHEPNDWRWCYSVNVFGVANGIMSFVGRMLESGEPGHVVNTSSGDGGFAPVPNAGVYASSKAAVSCLTEALAHQLAEDSDRVGASVFYPSGGLMDTGLFTSQRNRPAGLERVRGGTGRSPMTFQQMKDLLEKAGRDVKVADLDEMGRWVVDCTAQRQYIIGRDLDHTVDLLHRRADAIGALNLPPHHQMGL
ncbi:MAG TPA: short-chain dehydrogenase [Acidimicrobiaceae bacterium]|nr:short-chain dehydrogenase [Acidimicrobiaceae bacterium]|tara:strand:+ start:788 stop:1699 length:912 start_codon:yes stop_codon:yes gene_type:complete